MMARQVGGWRVTRIGDGEIVITADKLLGLEPSDAPGLVAAAGASAVNAFLLQGHGRTVLIDAGAGGTMGPELGRMQDSLIAARVSPAEVDTVLLTHFHPDHSNGLITAAGEAVFPHAALLAPELERRFWLDQDLDSAPAPMRPYLLAARAAAAAYGERFATLGAEPAPGVAPMAMPGHTPGHTGFRVGSGAEALLIWGDVMHVPSIQAARPEVGVVFDTDREQAVATRRRVLDMAAADRLLIAGMHLAEFCHVERDGTGYRLTA